MTLEDHKAVAVATVDYPPEMLFAGDYECFQRHGTLSAYEYGGDPTEFHIIGGHFLGAGVATMATAFDPFFDAATGEPIDCELEGEEQIPTPELIVGLAGGWHPNECTPNPGLPIVTEGFPLYVEPYDAHPDVPVLMAHGTEDETCPLAQAELAASEWEALGRPTELLVFESAGHIDDILFVANPDDWPDVEADPNAQAGRTVIAAITDRLG